MPVVKYTHEQGDELHDAYIVADGDDERKDVVVKYARLWNKPTRSIIAKLSKMGVYKSIARTSKVTGDKPETKEQLVRKLESKFFAIDGAWAGLEKAPKLVLVALLNAK